MTNNQRKAIINYLIDIEPADDEDLVEIEIRTISHLDGDDIKWFVTSDMLGVDPQTGECDEIDKQPIIDNWLLDQLMELLPRTCNYIHGRR